MNLPSNVNLAGAEIDFNRRRQKRVRVERRNLKGKKKNTTIYNYGLPPSLSMLTVNAMTAADTVLVPIQCEYYALEGLSQLMYQLILQKKKHEQETRDGRCCFYNV